MPVTVLLCEGARDSPDARVLNKLLAGYCTVQPIGSKFGMDSYILARRDASPTATVMGLKDGDFYREWVAPVDRPEPWSKQRPGGQTDRLGWSWARTEIENYLIDPEVVARALGPKAPPPERYREMLARAAQHLSDYTAARVALSRCRLTVRQLPNRWGKHRGSDRHPFPENLTRSACRRQIKRIVRSQTQGTLPEPRQVVAEFRRLLPLHDTNGIRRTHFLHTYAGKDLLIQMDGDLRQTGFGDFGDFRERILTGIDSTPDDIADWQPEWAALLAEIETYTP
jgi:hypothetical protein